MCCFSSRILTYWAQQTQSRYHIFVDYDMSNKKYPGILVPQEIYRAPKAYSQRPSIRFVVGGQVGVKLQSALFGNVNGLLNGSHTPALTGANRISCRILVQ